MRVCSKCGHHDPWFWRGSSVATGLEFCKLQEFKEEYPEIAQTLIEEKEKHAVKNFAFDKDYCYHLTRGLNVERQSLIENPTPKNQWCIPLEAAPNKNPSSFGLYPENKKRIKQLRVLQKKQQINIELYLPKNKIK